MPLRSGTRLGPYDVVAPIGAGGMGEVYRARDTKLNRDVAIKVLPEMFAKDPERLARFTREAQTLAALNHPNIAHIHGIEESASGQALVMELVEGTDLSTMIARDGAMPPKDATAIARQIADALEAAHDAGIVHRDLKPANIKVKDDGTVKVLDFGLAKLVGPDGTGAGPLASGASATMTSPAMTAMGVILGTASYMSPEQAKGRAVDRRADIWAFGAVWFEMLTGTPPFPGETITDVIAAVVTRDPDWSLLPAPTPPVVRRLLTRCLVKDPKQRLRDIGDVRLMLADGAESGAPPRTARTGGSGATGWIAAGVLLAALGAAIFWPREVTPAANVPIIKYDVMPAGKSTLRLDSRPGVAVSPDGSKIVFVATEDGVTKLYLRRRDDAEVRALPGTDGASDPVFSADGKWLAYAGAADLMRMSLDGTPVSVAKVNDSRGLIWLNDKEIVFSPEAVSGLFIVPASGGTPRALTSLDPKTDDRTHRWPAAVPGGKAVLFTVGKLSSPDNYDDARIDAVIVATGERRAVMEGASFVRVLSNGSLLYAKGGTLYAAPFDSERLVTTGAAVPVLQGVATDTTTGVAHVSVAGDGTLAYIPGGSSTADRQIVWSDRKGTISPIALPPGLYNDIRVSPDGARIAVLVGSSGAGDVWIYDTHSTAFTRLTFDQKNASPVWSGDGRWIYYASIKSTGDETTVRRRPVDGSREPESLGVVKTRGFLDAVDPSGKMAYLTEYALRQTSYVDIGQLPLAGGPHTLLIGGQGSQSASSISPDGRWLAYQSDEGSRFEIYVRDLSGAGGRSPVSTTGGEEPRWSADGREIFYRNDTRFMVAAVTTKPEFRSNPPQVLFEGIYNLRSDTGMTYDVDSKTGRFAMLRPAGQAAGAAAARVRVVMNWIEGALGGARMATAGGK
ncbi:MAG TPA: protein kinase [Vicinamibacterales bacterium]|nr:protein kinase [Vicinamibacterales bacterium]